MEVWDLFNEINEEIGTKWEQDKLSNERGFVLSFPNDQLPRPRYLGISKTKATYDTLIKALTDGIRGLSAIETEEDAKAVNRALRDPDVLTIEASRSFRIKIELANTLSKWQNPSDIKTKKAKQRQGQKEGSQVITIVGVGLFN
jgi:hypothetical protein